MAGSKSNWRNHLEKDEPWSCNERFSIPMFERMKILYALGHTPAIITSTLQNEFQDIEVNPITIQTVQQILESRKAEFVAFKEEVSVEVAKEGLIHLKDVIRRVAESENRFVVAAATKMDNLVDAMLTLDLTIADEEGNLKNLAQYCRLLEATEKTQKIIAKLSGTDALRDLEIYLRKANIDQAAKGGSSMIPLGAGGERPNVD